MVLSLFPEFPAVSVRVICFRKKIYLFEDEIEPTYYFFVSVQIFMNFTQKISRKLRDTQWLSG